VKPARAEQTRIERPVLLIERNGCLLLRRRSSESARLAGFWELPDSEELPRAKLEAPVSRFRHTITRYSYHYIVWKASIRRVPLGFDWIDRTRLGEYPLSTAARKALSACAASHWI
jgi:hypothetical protein